MGTFVRRRTLIRAFTRTRAVVAIVALVAASAVVLDTSVAQGALADTAPASSSTPATVSADPLPTVQQNGVVWSQVVVGNTVYATGSFSETWPAGQADTPATDTTPGNETARTNLLAYNITTGNLITSFDHALGDPANPDVEDEQGLALAVSPDGKTLYVTGDFTTVDGQPRSHIAAFDISTAAGTLSKTFAPNLSGTGRALAVTANTVYVGGSFTQAGGQARSRLAAFSASNGALLSWAPPATSAAGAQVDDPQVDALAMSPDGSRVIAGGRFQQLNGADVYGLGSLDASTGATKPFAINSQIRDVGSNAQCGITSLTVAAGVVYGTGYAYKCGNFEGRFAADPNTGNPIWINDCHGDSYSSAAVGSVLYSVGHAHDCSLVGSFPDKSAPGLNQRALAETTYATGKDTGPDSYGSQWNYAGQPAASILHWFPALAPGSVTHQDQAAWSVVGTSDYIALGGEFPTVNGIEQTGLVRFAVRADAPNKVAPRPSAGLTPTLTSTSSGSVTVSWVTTWDYDNQNLTYDVLRDGETTPIATLHSPSTFWQLPTLSYTDTGLAPGSSHTYRIRVSDPLGNKIGGTASMPITVSSSGGATSGPDYTETCSSLSCSFTASPSGASDAVYSWDFGDGTTGSGANPTHDYATAGDKRVTLLVTSDGSTSSASRVVSVTKAAPAVWANDAFNRNRSGSWGSGKVGGAWSTLGRCRRTTVGHGGGYLSLSVAKTCGQHLPDVFRSSTDTTTQVTTTSLPRGGVYVSVLGRRVSASANVAMVMQLRHDGRIAVALQARAAGRIHTLASTVLNLHYEPRAQVHVRLEVTGTAPTHVAAKVWVPTSSAAGEPKGWTLSGTTSLTAVQHYGDVGLTGYVPRAKGAAAVLMRVESFVSTAASA